MIFSISRVGTYPFPPTKKKEKDLDTDLTPFTKIHSKWITDIQVKHKTIKLLEDNIRENLGSDDDSSDTPPKAQSMKDILS